MATTANDCRSVLTHLQATKTPISTVTSERASHTGVDPDVMNGERWRMPSHD